MPPTRTQAIAGMPLQALSMLDGLAEDNLEILVDLGVNFVLYEFGRNRVIGRGTPPAPG